MLHSLDRDGIEEPVAARGAHQHPLKEHVALAPMAVNAESLGSKPFAAVLAQLGSFRFSELHSA